MTPEEIKKEQEASKLNPIQSIQQIETKPSQLEKPQSVNTTSPSESEKDYAGKVSDYKTVVSEAKSKGIDLNNQEGVPLLDSDKERIIQNASRLAPKELVSDVVNRINTYARPEFEKVPEIDQKVLLARQRQARRARLYDALYAFGEGLQGNTANPELFASNRIQRKNDQEFQKYLDVTERNRKARNLWNAQTTDETIKWLDEQAKNERLDKLTREKMAQAADQFRQKQEQSKKIADDRNATTLKAAGIRASKLDKDQKPVVIQTSKNTYQLKPEEAAFMKGEVMKNSEDYRAKYPGWFEKVQKTNDFGQPIEGEYTYKLNPRIKDADIIRAYLEKNKEGTDLITEENQASYFDKYRRAKGQPTSDVPVSETVKAGSQPVQYSQPKQTPKADPLGLGL